jgi:hypothetical protein
MSPHLIANVRTVGSCAAGVLFAAGSIRTAAWLLGCSACLGLIRRLDSRGIAPSPTRGVPRMPALDCIADGFLFGGITFFFATDAWHRFLPMVAVGITGMLATMMSIYAEARAEMRGVAVERSAIMVRPERFVLLAVPQAFLGLALDGMLLRSVFVLFGVSAIVRAVNRMAVDYLATQGLAPSRAQTVDYTLLGPSLFSRSDSSE